MTVSIARNHGIVLQRRLPSTRKQSSSEEVSLHQMCSRAIHRAPSVEEHDLRLGHLREGDEIAGSHGDDGAFGSERPLVPHGYLT